MITKLNNEQDHYLDFDITQAFSIHRACLPKDLKRGETFNLYLNPSSKVGVTWLGNTSPKDNPNTHHALANSIIASEAYLNLKNQAPEREKYLLAALKQANTISLDGRNTHLIANVEEKENTIIIHIDSELIPFHFQFHEVLNAYYSDTLELKALMNVALPRLTSN
ncbi:hypothetical protein ACP3V3_16990 [Vibrio sp. PNB22_3_1]